MNIKYLLPLIMLTSCVDRATTDYVKDNGIKVHRETEEGYEKVQFYSGCLLVSFEHSYRGFEQIKITMMSKPELCPEPQPVREEVFNLISLVQRYSTPCTTLDENGNPADYEGNSPEVIKTCHERGNPKDIGTCLLQGAPKGWSVDCR